MLDQISVSERLHLTRSAHGKRELVPGPRPAPEAVSDRVPRVSLLMALAIKFEHLLATGAAPNQAALAKQAQLTRARVTQVMNLLHLAPDLQEAVLCLPCDKATSCPITEQRLRPIAAELSWQVQRAMWATLWPAIPTPERSSAPRARSGTGNPRVDNTESLLSNGIVSETGVLGRGLPSPRRGTR